MRSHGEKWGVVEGYEEYWREMGSSEGRWRVVEGYGE